MQDRKQEQSHSQRDALLELEIMRQKERQDRIQNEYVIMALSELVETQSASEAIASILEMISELFLSDNVGVVVMANETIQDVHATAHKDVWTEHSLPILHKFCEKSDRVFSEMSEIDAWKSASDKLKILGESVMVVRKTIRQKTYLAYCFHQTPSAYNNRDVTMFEKLVKALLQAVRMKESHQKRERLEQDLRQAQKLEALGTLASGVAHEINTPIQYIGDNLNFINETFEELMQTIENAVLSGNLSSLKEDLAFFKEEVPAAAKDAMDGASQVSKIVASMKSFSYPCGGEMVLTDLNEALQASITISRNVWKHGVKIQTEFDESLPKIEAIRDELNQVWLNMIVNASHAVHKAPSGTGTLTISTRQEDDKTVAVEIKDTGVGIKAENINRIFEPFFTTKGVGKGTGQGLAIAYEIVKTKHDGMIDVTSEEGRGTTFTVRLPIRQKEQNED